MLGAAVLWLLIAVPIGAYGALRPRSFGDVIGRTFAILGMSIPIFWVAPMLSYLLGYQPTQGELVGLHILPVGTSHLPDRRLRASSTTNPAQWAHHLLLPWLALRHGFAAVYARYIRTLTARAAGRGLHAHGPRRRARSTQRS